jgi:hypothetical protein
MSPARPPQHRQCGVQQVTERLYELDPNLRGRHRRIEDECRRSIEKGEAQRVWRKLVTIQVVVHVVAKTEEEDISDEQIDRQIEVLNQDYRGTNPDRSKVPDPWTSLVADPNIQFALATKDPRGKPTNGITRVQTTRDSFGTGDSVKTRAGGGTPPWATDRYLNIWVCNLGEGLLGYAQFPGGPAKTDGVVILYTAFGTKGAAAEPFNLGRTATHEVGHWLNLFHIWGDDGTGCRGTDHCPDTPNQASENYGEPAFPHVSCNNGPNGDLFMDYMDYVDDVAMFMYTGGQATRMNGALNGWRKKLFESVPRFPGVLGPSPRRRPAVKRVQEELRDRWDHPDLRADGVYAEKTERIVRTFQQRRHGAPWRLPVDGKVGKKTWAAIFA